VIKSFLRLPSKILGNQLHLDYAIRRVYEEILLRSPAHSEVKGWRHYLKTFGIVAFIKQVQSSEEGSALRAKIESQKVLFMHIPRTAGSSFRGFFEKFTDIVYTTHAKQNPCPVEKACLINGHFGFSFMNHTTYDHSFTILRDPIERIISLYRYSQSERSGWESVRNSQSPVFCKWLSSDNPYIHSQIDSYYVRAITDDIVEPLENRIAESVKLAIERYSAFSAVGDQSDLKPLCLKVSSLLDIPVIYLPVGNDSCFLNRSTANYPSRPKLTPEIQDRLGQLTRLDYEIYNRFRAK
jgi:hypothetical protein